MAFLIYAIVAVVTAAAAVYQYFLWQSQYWRRRGVPGPDSRLFYGNSKELTKYTDPSPLKLFEWTKKYGKVYGYKEGVRNVLVISDIDLINEIFVKQFDAFYARREPPLSSNIDDDPRANLFESRGSRWKRLRGLASPSFSINSLKTIQPLVEDSALKMVELMGEAHDGGASFNVHRFYTEFTLDTICRLVLGQNESTLFHNSRHDVYKAIFQTDFDRPIIHLAAGMPVIARSLRELVKKASLGASNFVGQVFSDIERTVTERIEQRYLNGPPEKSADFIDLFLDSAAEFDYKESGEFSTQDRVIKALTVDEVIGQAFVFLLAGFDTTANALAYTTWMLSRRPDILKRCQDEVDQVCRDSSISYEDTQQLRYLDAVCRETLRLYPLGAKVVARTCMKPSILGGYAIEQGTTVMVDTYAVHFTKELWGDDAEEFRPERWLEAEKRQAAINFLSFGAGPRLCIGMRLAMMEEKIALAHLLRRFDIIADEKVNNLKLVGCTTITPETVPIKIASRS